MLAVEVIAARQAWRLRGAPPGPGLAAIAGPLEDLVVPVDEHGPLGDDVHRVAGLLRASG